MDTCPSGPLALKLSDPIRGTQTGLVLLRAAPPPPRAQRPPELPAGLALASHDREVPLGSEREPVTGRGPVGRAHRLPHPHLAVGPAFLPGIAGPCAAGRVQMKPAGQKPSAPTEGDLGVLGDLGATLTAGGRGNWACPWGVSVRAVRAVPGVAPGTWRPPWAQTRVRAPRPGRGVQAVLRWARAGVYPEAGCPPCVHTPVPTSTQNPPCASCLVKAWGCSPLPSVC